MEECLNDIEYNPKRFSWSLGADESWSEDFLKALVAAPSEDMRMQMIAERCDPKVWQRLAEKIQEDQTGVRNVRFIESIRDLMDLQKEEPEEQGT